ncbi:MAG TPA: hypothetical protein VHD90_05390 [Phototrophicaceae bacterium]|nr:hypothetical protein [Phototrophicaceae bacterium]
MPAISSGDAAILRQFPQTIKRYLSSAPRDVVFAAQVSSSGGAIQRDGVSGGVFAIAYTSVTTGAYTDVIGGMTLDIGTTAGAADIGQVRVRSASAAQILTAETVLPNLSGGQYLTVRREFRPWPIKPHRFDDYADAAYPTSFTEFHDYDQVYSNQNAHIEPKANITADGYTLIQPAGFVDAGQTYRTVSFSAANSITLATGASITGWAWAIADGTVVAGGTTLPIVTARFPVGFRYVALTVTDSNGTTQTMRVPIWVHDDDHLPMTEFTVTKDVTRAGREMSFEIFGAADVSVIPEGSTICYWEAAEFGDDPAPDGYRGQFLGWALRDATKFQLYRSRYTLDVAGAAGWLDRLGSYAQTLIDPGRTPTQWHEMQNLTLDRAAHYALRSYTNVLTLVTFYPSGVNDVTQTLDLKKASVWAQIGALVKGYYGAAGADSLGGIWLRRQQSSYSAADQALFTADITLTNADWTDAQGFSLSEEKTETVGLVEANGSIFGAGTTIPVASTAHGNTGVGRATAPFQYVSSQDQLNELTGRYLAQLNNPYPKATLKLIGNLDAIEPAWNEPIAISSAGDNVRGLTLSGARFLVTQVSVEHSNEPGKPPKSITWTLEGITSGEAGITLDVPAPVIKPPAPPPSSSGKVVKALLSPGTGTIAAPNDDGYVYITHNFSATTPTWTRYSLVSLGMHGLLVDFVPDPFSPLYLGTGSQVNGWLVTEREIGHLADIFGTSPTYTVQFTFAATITAYDGQRLIETERSTQNFVVVVSYYPSAGTKAIVTTDGVHWGTETTLTSGHPYSYLSPGLAVSGKQANVALSAAASGSSFQGYKYSGGSWAAISSPNISGTGLPGWMHVPWANNDDSLVFYGASTVEPSADKLYRALGTTRTDITPTAGGKSYTCRYPRSIDTPALNNNRVVLCGFNDPSGSTNHNAVFASKDQGNSWSVIYGPINTTSSDYLSVRCAGDDEDVFYLFGPGGHITYSADFGATLQDKRGNLTDSAFAGIDRFVNICGG